MYGHRTVVEVIKQPMRDVAGQGAALCHMIEDEFCHFEHADSLFAVKDFAKFFVRSNESFVFGVLQIMAAYVIPKLLRDLRAS